MKRKDTTRKLIAKDNKSIRALENRLDVSPPNTGADEMKQLLEKHKQANRSLQYVDSDAMRQRLEENRKRTEKESKASYFNSQLIRIIGLTVLLVVALVVQDCNG